MQYSVTITENSRDSPSWSSQGSISDLTSQPRRADCPSFTVCPVFRFPLILSLSGSYITLFSSTHTSVALHQQPWGGKWCEADFWLHPSPGPVCPRVCGGAGWGRWVGSSAMMNHLHSPTMDSSGSSISRSTGGDALWRLLVGWGGNRCDV